LNEQRMFCPGDVVLTDYEHGREGQPGKWWILERRLFGSSTWKVKGAGVVGEHEIVARVRHSPAIAASSSSDV
jgi:hypothetical protein